MIIGTNLYVDTEIYQISTKAEIALPLADDISVLFIAPNTAEESYLDTYASLVKNIFDALKLTDTSYKVLVLDHGIELKQLYQSPNIEYLIFFGGAAQLVDFQFEYIKNRSFAVNGKKIIFTDHLHLLSNPASKVQKNEFWSGLQRMFAKT